MVQPPVAVHKKELLAPTKSAFQYVLCLKLSFDER